MKISVLPLLIVGASLAQQASANPLRVIITEISTFRFGHAAANANTANVAHITPPNMLTNSADLEDAGRHKKPHHRHHRPCGSSLKNKAIAISNAFRKALGLPLIEKFPHAQTTEEKATHGNLVHILPIPFTGTAASPVHVDGDAPVQHHRHGHYFKIHRDSFGRRMHQALMELSPWEGRAVAFVLGCGIGVLLRMMWVLCLVSYRLVRGRRSEPDYTELVFEQDAEELAVPPPVYTDEKSPLPQTPKTG